MSQIYTKPLGLCDKKQYEHAGPHTEVTECGQSMPPFPCKNWKPIAEPSMTPIPPIPGDEPTLHELYVAALERIAELTEALKTAEERHVTFMVQGGPVVMAADYFLASRATRTPPQEGQ